MNRDSKIDRSEIEQVFVGRLVVPRLYSALLSAQDNALEALGITARQGSMLLNCALGEAETPAELARVQGLDISTVTRMVERLCRKKLIKRSRDRHDRRRVILAVTPKGHEVLKAGIPAARDVARTAWHGVTEAERRALISLTEKILKNLGHEPWRPSSS